MQQPLMLRVDTRRVHARLRRDRLDALALEVAEQPQGIDGERRARLRLLEHVADPVEVVLLARSLGQWYPCPMFLTYTRRAMVRRWWLSVAALALAATSVSSGCNKHASEGSVLSDTQLREAQCLGPSTEAARGFVVYLHGVDSPTVSQQEMENRRRLTRIAAELSLRVALPRATAACPGQAGSLCWGWSFDDAEMARTASAVDAAARTCFGERSFQLVGFSNGGYLLTKALSACSLRRRFPRATNVLTVGSAMLRGPLEPTPTELKGCGALVMLIGSSDTYNFDPAENYLHALQAKGADVRSVRFDGDHMLPYEPTRSLLQSP